ncbi:MAG: cupin [Micrococcaceae bacterium]|jgi:quercetin dioxygenase-like cupin family protein|nr:cupin [Micrococcaceae bacterium]
MNDLAKLAEEHLAVALQAEHGRSTVLVAQDGPLRQALIALRAGIELGEHTSPRVAGSIYVIEGSVTVASASARTTVGENQLHVLAKERHSVLANEDAVFLLTAVNDD